MVARLEMSRSNARVQQVDQVSVIIEQISNDEQG